MKNLIYFFLVFILPFIACQKANKCAEFEPKSFTYQEMKAPDFFKNLVVNHIKDFEIIDGYEYQNFASSNNIDTLNESNKNKFFTIKILHKLFTSKNAKNGSRGEILNIPYFWHWTNPNPRHDIIDLKTNQILNQIVPPEDFLKYKSLADVDRTPFLFISDLLSEKSKYYTQACGNFNTFGWCSEREMSFVCLLKTLDLEGKVITNDNHSWSEYIVLMQEKNKKNINFKVTVDNTFDDVNWEVISSKKIEIWRKKISPRLGKWYNEKANSIFELKKIKELNCSKIAMQNIETNVVDFLKKQL